MNVSSSVETGTDFPSGWNKLVRIPGLGVLFLILLVGTALRLYGLDHQSFWADELATWEYGHYQPLAFLIQNVLSRDQHPPTYYILIHFVERYLGETEWALRLPSSLSGIAGIAVIYFLGKQLFTEMEGRVAAVWMAILWAPIYYSQEARSYSFLILLSMVVVGSWYALLKRRISGDGANAAFYLAVYFVSALALAHLHYYGFFFIGLQFLYTLLWSIRARKNRLFVLAVFIPIFLTYLPWIILRSQNIGRGIEWIQPVTAHPQVFSFYLSGYLGYLFNESRGLLALVFAVTGAAVLKQYVAHRLSGGSKRDFLSISSPEVLVFLWLFMPFLSLYLISLVFQPVLMIRAILISLPAAYLLLARAITALFKTALLRGVVVVFLSGLFLFNLIVVKDYYRKPQKAQIREAAAFIANHDTYNGESAVVGYSIRKTFIDYYLERLDAPQRVEFLGGAEGDIPAAAEFLEANPGRYLWYIYGARKPDPAFLDFLSGSYVLIDHQDYFQAGVFLFAPAPE